MIKESSFEEKKAMIELINWLKWKKALRWPTEFFWPSATYHHFNQNSSMSSCKQFFFSDQIENDIEFELE